MLASPTQKPPLTSLRVQNFKAIADSGAVQFGWFNLLIGNNGTGKSSLLEALDLYRTLARLPWFEGAANFGEVVHQGVSGQPKRRIEIAVKGYELALVAGAQQSFLGRIAFGRGTLNTAASYVADSGAMHLLHDEVQFRGEKWHRDRSGQVRCNDAPTRISFAAEFSLANLLAEVMRRIQFLSLDPSVMGGRQPTTKVRGQLSMIKAGSNIAEYLWDLKQASPLAFNGVVSVLRAVVPYATDLHIRYDTAGTRTFELELVDGKRRIPGNALSAGTLRLVALIACLRHPSPPPVLVVEEIENGLDPRTLDIVVEEMRKATARGRTQIIATTHSIALLDYVPMVYVILCERNGDAATFRRPIDDEDVRRWAGQFPTGTMYAAGRLRKEQP